MTILIHLISLLKSKGLPRWL
jgi:hypothetical protein